MGDSRSRLESDIRRGAAGNGDWFALWLGSFMPSDERVPAVGNIVDFEVATSVGLSVIRRRADDDVTRHLLMKVTQQWNDARLVKLEGAFVALRPSTEI